MIDLNVATAAELNEMPELKGHGFEIVLPLRSLVAFPQMAGDHGFGDPDPNQFSIEAEYLRHFTGLARDSARDKLWL